MKGMINKWFSIIFLVCISTTSLSQIQHGYIRTLCRPNRPSVPIANVTVNVSTAGNALLTQQNGTFSFTCSNASYRILRVQKNGYQLVDKGVIGRETPFSASVKQEIVMVSQNDLEADKKRIEDKAFERAQDEYQRRIATIKQQYEEKLITAQKAAEDEKKVGDNYQKYINLIEEMAERYALTDYEGISVLNMQILQYIEDAELEKADSLINQKGDIKVRIAEIKQQLLITEATEENAKKLREDLTTKTNDLAEDLYNKHMIFRSKYQNDSAEYYLKLRFELDTTNIEWIDDLAIFIQKNIANYDLALFYLQKELKIAIEKYGKNHNRTALSYNNLAVNYFHQGLYNKAVDLHSKALTIQGNDSNTKDKYKALSYHNIANVYLVQADFEKALEFFNLAEDYYKKDTLSPLTNIAQLYNDIGCCFAKLYKFDNAIEYLNKALVIRKDLFGMKHHDVSLSYNNIGWVYSEMGQYDKSLENYYNALTSYRSIFIIEHPDVATTYVNIGRVYSLQKKYNEALELYNKGLSIFKKFLGENHPDVATTYDNIAYIYVNQKDFQMALSYLTKSLTIRKHMLGSDHPDIGTTYSNIAKVYLDIGKIDESLAYCEKALSILTKGYGPEHPYTAAIYGNIGDIFVHREKYKEAMQYYKRALKIFENELGTTHINTIKLKEKIRVTKDKD